MFVLRFCIKRCLEMKMGQIFAPEVLEKNNYGQGV